MCAAAPVCYTYPMRHGRLCPSAQLLIEMNFYVIADKYHLFTGRFTGFYHFLIACKRRAPPRAQACTRTKTPPTAPRATRSKESASLRRQT